MRTKPSCDDSRCGGYFEGSAASEASSGGSTIEANAAMRAIVRRDNGETYLEMLTRMATESDVETPTIDVRR
jgi:hypothetical protein